MFLEMRWGVEGVPHGLGSDEVVGAYVVVLGFCVDQVCEVARGWRGIRRAG